MRQPGIGSDRSDDRHGRSGRRRRHVQELAFCKVHSYSGSPCQCSPINRTESCYADGRMPTRQVCHCAARPGPHAERQSTERANLGCSRCTIRGSASTDACRREPAVERSAAIRRCTGASGLIVPSLPHSSFLLLSHARPPLPGPCTSGSSARVCCRMIDGLMDLAACAPRLRTQVSISSCVPSCTHTFTLSLAPLSPPSQSPRRRRG